MNDMLKRLNHIAIAVPNLDIAVDNYKKAFEIEITSKQELIKHGVTTVFIKLDNTNIELLEPLGKDSPIDKFLKRNPAGSIHHLCYEVEDIKLAILNLQNKGYNILGNGIPREGAHGKPVIFLHPKEFNGTLIELEEN
jgi:methylmalonyl-CoA/ethylmalonyl-CoA epimerase